MDFQEGDRCIYDYRDTPPPRTWWGYIVVRENPPAGEGALPTVSVRDAGSSLPNIVAKARLRKLEDGVLKLDEPSVDVYVNRLGITKLDCAGVQVKGRFECSHNQLTTLEGSPDFVGDFSVDGNPLKSLKGCPKEIVTFTLSATPYMSWQWFPDKVGAMTIDHTGARSVPLLIPMSKCRSLRVGVMKEDSFSDDMINTNGLSVFRLKLALVNTKWRKFARI